MGKMRKTALSLALLCCALAVGAYDFMEGGIAYNINPDGESVTVTYEQQPDANNGIKAYTNAAGSLVIPEFVVHGGVSYKVTIIGNSAFNGCDSFTGSLTIPKSVTVIDDGAFGSCCGFTGTLIIPDGVTKLGTSAFQDCSGFTGSLTIPNSVKEMGVHVFLGCSGFNGTLTLSNSVVSYGWRVFQDCSGFTGSLVIPETVVSIGSYTFAGCSGFDGSLIIGNSVSQIDSEIPSFQGCTGFTGSLVIGNSLRSTDALHSLGNKFKGELVIGKSLEDLKNIPRADFETIVVHKDNGKYDSRSSCNAIIETGTNTLVRGCKSSVIPDNIKTIGPQAFIGCRSFIGTLTIPNSVTTIGKDAFCDCSGLTGSLVIPNSVIEIGEGAFARCSGFNGTLTIGNSVKTIGQNAFVNDIGFAGSLVIPNSVTTIGLSAFRDCYGFTGSLTIGTDVTTIAERAFENFGKPTELNWNAIRCHSTGKIPTNNLETVSIGLGVEVIPERLAANSKITSILIPSTVKTIERNAFDQCTNLSRLTIPNSVDTIENGAFSYCTGLAKIDIPASVKYVGKNAFSSCTGVAKVVFDNSACTIGDNAFGQCSNLTQVDFGNAVTMINRLAFQSCISLTDIVVPASVRHIGSQAFSTGYVRSIKVDDGNVIYDSRDGCNAIIERKSGKLILGCFKSDVPDGVTCIGDSAFYWESGGSSRRSLIKLPATVKSIGALAFRNFPVEEMKLNEGLTEIGKSAFSQSKICRINIPSSVTSIGGYAFAGCSSLLEILSGSEKASSSLARIGQYAFSECSALTAIHARESWLMDFPANALLGVNRSLCTLYVPKDKMDAFRNHDVWGSFTNIKNEPPKIAYNVLSEADKTVEVAQDDYEGKIVIPPTTDISGVTYRVVGIAERAFEDCDVTSISIPESVTLIGEQAFRGTSKLTSISVSNANPVFDSRNNCNAVIHTASGTLMAGCCNTVIPADVVNIGADAFHGCSTLKEIAIPESVQRIGQLAFARTGLERLAIPGCVKAIGRYAFSECKLLSEIILNTGLVAIGEGAFERCSKLLELSIPEGVTEISKYMCFDCIGLQRLTLPSTTKSIDKEPFCMETGSSKLVEIHSHIRNLFSFSESAFSGVSKSMCKLYVPLGMKDAYRAHLVWGEFFTIIEEDTSIRGDVDGSGVVDVDDLNIVINIMLRKAMLERWPAADIDRNGVVDVDDLNHVINVMLRKE